MDASNSRTSKTEVPNLKSLVVFPTYTIIILEIWGLYLPGIICVSLTVLGQAQLGSVSEQYSQHMSTLSIG